MRHCSKCHRLLTVYNKDKCEEKRKGACRSLSFNARISSNQAEHQHPTKEISKATFRVVEENFLPEDRLFISSSTSPINLTKHFQRYAATKGITWTSASCSKVIKDLISDEDWLNVYDVIHQQHAIRKLQVCQTLLC